METESPHEQERHFIEQIALFMEASGTTRMAGRILGWLLICAPPEQSAAQIAAALQASKGSISTNTRLLLHTELIEKVSLPGRRLSFFRVTPDAWHKLIEKQVSVVRSFRELLEQGLTMLDAAPLPQRARLLEALEFYRFLEKEMPLLIEHWHQQH